MALEVLEHWRMRRHEAAAVGWRLCAGTSPESLVFRHAPSFRLRNAV